MLVDGVGAIGPQLRRDLLIGSRRCCGRIQLLPVQIRV
jgi:hypothetical protein